MTGRLKIEHKLFRPGQQGYEDARRASVWRANTPARFPAAIVAAEDREDVVAAVRLAVAEGLQVGVASGGHSWTSPHLRDDALLLDVSRLNRLRIDVDARTAWVEPGAKGRALNDALAPHGLMAPTGHHDTVACGGFLLCGGFGWNFRQWGVGCANVVELEVVTADGAVIMASEHENPDVFFAARGGGAGFFGVVTGFRVKAYPRPARLRANTYVFPLDAWEPVMAWLHALGPALARNVELVAAASAAAGDPRIVVNALAFAETEAEAAAAAKLMRACPLADLAVTARLDVPTTLEERYALSTAADPAGFRYAVDNLYLPLSAAEAAIPLMAPLFTTMPTPRTHVFWLYQGERPKLDGMALSTWGETYLAAYPIWSDAAQDEAMEAWVTDGFRRLEPLSTGGQMNDENMLGRAQPYLAPAASAQLEAARARRDPQRRFLSFLEGIAV